MQFNRLYLLPTKRLARCTAVESTHITFAYVDREGGAVDLVPSFAKRECALVVPPVSSPGANLN